MDTFLEQEKHSLMTTDNIIMTPPTAPTTDLLETLVPSQPAAHQDRDDHQPLANAKSTIVDDEQLNIDLVQAYLEEESYHAFRSTTDSTNALELIRDYEPDVVLLDLMMPNVDGFEILVALRDDERLKRIPVIVLTAASSSFKLQALELGATDFLGKPVDPSELILRMRNTLEAKAYKDHLESHSTRLEGQVKVRTRELDSARQEALLCLARAAECRDDDTGHHVIRVGRYAAIVARRLGFNDDQIGMLEQAAQLHDIGKIGIPDSILLKADRLTPEEIEFMRYHCAFGKRIIQPTSAADSAILQQNTEMGARFAGISSSPVMTLAASIAMTHHERWDGTGYPNGLAGEDIPIEGRITSVADVYDALSCERPYKKAFPPDKCLEIMEEGRLTQFDPRVLDAFFDSYADIVRVATQFADPA
jgi:putative two-component system response regulator